MALAETTLSSAVGAGDKEIAVASATSVAAGRLLRIDDEVMEVTKGYVTASTTVPVLRGRQGTPQSAHVTSARVVHGDASDFGATAPGLYVPYGLSRTRRIVSVSATSSLTLPKPGEDLIVVLNGTSAITLTIPAPTLDLDGCMMLVISNGVAAHVPTFTGGLGGVGSGYTALTVATGARLAILVVAINEAWNVISAPAWTGTVTKVTAGIA